MTPYQWLKFGHILAVIVWVGGGVWTQLYAARARREQDPNVFAGLVRQVVWAGNRVFMPASFATLITGVALVFQGSFRFSEPWISVGFLGFLITAVTGAAVLGPAGRRVASAIEAHGAGSDDVRSAGSRFISLMRIDLVIVVLVVLDMVIKPGLGRS